MMFGFSVNALAGCPSQATTEYERIYCDIVARGEGKTLPGFEDFKRNDATVQKLLLKRPAAKLKIKLPKQLKKNTKRVSASKKSTVEKTTKTLSAKPPEKTDEIKNPHVYLSQCSLTQDAISCGNRRFNLKKNQPNSRLAKGVLEDHYLMGLPDYNGPAENGREVQFYLADAYSVYVTRMIDIGLGASTMSYARFYHTYQDLKSKNVAFSARFETMYRFLKKDKKTMAVKTEPSLERPSSLSQCDDISDQIIGCDIGVINWVYVN